ncbi:MAG: AraC family transcriptional regulator, partial [Alistipes sp.]|nr:AraC family transcriptional regulator [Alistipes sp.]
MTEQQPNPMQMADNEAFKVGELDLDGAQSYSGRIDFGALLLCRKGRVDLTIDDLHCTLRRNTSAMILPGSMVSLTSPSDDLRISYFAFSAQLFAEAAFRLDID